mmetsp:Transcript_8598/g.21700  ORF Transcript_8598/g.21700 Transcript_8598/m.21700 type:complete len:298 (-) Transcript_8598:20-913(-)
MIHVRSSSEMQQRHQERRNSGPADVLAPPPEPRVRLSNVFADALMLKYFREFAHDKNMMQDELTFWIDTKRFRRLSNVNPSSTAEAGLKLFERYFGDGSSPSFLKLSPEDRDKLYNKLRDGTQTELQTLFELFEAQAAEDLSTKLLPKFLKSSFYVRYHEEASSATPHLSMKNKRGSSFSRMSSLVFYRQPLAVSLTESVDGVNIYCRTVARGTMVCEVEHQTIIVRVEPLQQSYSSGEVLLGTDELNKSFERRIELPERIKIDPLSKTVEHNKDTGVVCIRFSFRSSRSSGMISLG